MKKLCTGCFTSKPLTEFNKKKSGYQHYCKTCASSFVSHYRKLKAGPKNVHLKLSFTADEWQQILLSMGEKPARQFIVEQAKQSILAKVF